MDLLLQPRVNELELAVYNRALHPELFHVLRQQTVQFQETTIQARVTPSGHVFIWKTGDVQLWQILGPCGDFLPEKGRLLTRQPAHGQGAHLDFSPGWRYELVVQVEEMSTHQFEQFHDDIEAEGRRRGLTVRFWPTEEPQSTLPGLAFLSAEARPGCFVLTAIHTHPRENKAVKILSLIERPDAAAPWGFGRSETKK